MASLEPPRAIRDIRWPTGYMACKGCNRVLEKKDADKNGKCVDCRPEESGAPTTPETPGENAKTS